MPDWNFKHSAHRSLSPPVTYTAAWYRRRWSMPVSAAVLLAAGAALWFWQEQRIEAARHARADALAAASADSKAERPMLRFRDPAMTGAAGGRLAPPLRLVPRSSAEPGLSAWAAPPGVAGAFTSALPATAHAGQPEELPVFSALRASRSHPIPAEVAALARKITEGCTNDAARARALYDWLTANIRYDVAEWAHITGGGDQYMNAHDPMSVLARGTTVCSGYSWLFDAMARSVGLDSTFLIGDVRGYRGTPDDALVSAFKHAWNAVQIDGAWQLLDATWGARQTGESDADYLMRQAYYYATPPSQLIFDHLPESTEWQLLDDPLPDAVAFGSQPNLKPSFFENGLRLVNAFSSTVTADAASGGTLLLTAPETVGVVATLNPRSDGAAAATIPVVVSGDQRRVVIEPLPRGEYILRIYSKTAADTRYTCSADFVIRAE
jgi:hypothetical protein